MKKRRKQLLRAGVPKEKVRRILDQCTKKNIPVDVFIQAFLNHDKLIKEKEENED